MWIDSHCHLNFDDYKNDLDDVLRRARDVGVKRFITINTHIKDAKKLHKIADTYDDVFCTIGNHPNEAYLCEGLYDEIKNLCLHKKVVGIGESGLDYFYEGVDGKIQQESFEIHINVANALDLPVVVHTREAEEDTLYWLKKLNRGVLHCFTSSYDLAKKAVDLGFYISFSGILTFKNAGELREIAKKLPMDRLIVETDAPYLTPEPRRKIKRNEPAFVCYTGAKLAQIKEISEQEMAQITTRNCIDLFFKKFNDL